MNEVCEAPYGGLTSPPTCSRQPRELVRQFTPVKYLLCNVDMWKGPNLRGGPVQGLLTLFMDEDKVAQRGQGWARGQCGQVPTRSSDASPGALPSPFPALGGVWALPHPPQSAQAVSGYHSGLLPGADIAFAPGPISLHHPSCQPWRSQASFLGAAGEQCANLPSPEFLRAPPWSAVRMPYSHTVV